MSQNPYATTYGGVNDLQPVARTSVLAIVSLVSSLICCIPVVTGALGALLGGVAVIRIGASNGQRKGLGLAIAGIVIGLITSIIWLFVIIGAYQGMKQFAQMTQPLVQSFNTSDPSKLKNALNPALAAKVSDADVVAFKSAVEAEIGTLDIPNSPIDFLAGYGKAGPLMENTPNSRNVVPLPLRGTKGYGMLLIQLPRRGGQGSSMEEAVLGSAENLGVILPSGTIVWLVNEDAPALPATSPREMIPSPEGSGAGKPQPGGV